MKKIIFALTIALLLPVLTLTVTASAPAMAIELPNLWEIGGDIVTAIGDTISGFFTSLRDSLQNFLYFVGSLLSDIGNAIANLVESFLNGLYNIFVPRDDYFYRIIIRLESKLNEKFGGIIGLADYLKERFSSIGSADTSKMFNVNLQATEIMPSFSFDLLLFVRQYMPTIRAAITGFLTLMTVAFSYKKAKEIVNV
jgi:hypothetical protein